MTFATLLVTTLFTLAAPPQMEWPQWRGPNRDGVSTETGLLKTWPDGGPKKLWTTDNLGGGYSTPSIAGGLIFGLGKISDPAKGKDASKEAVWAVKESDGSLAWIQTFADAKKVGYGEGGRSTPTVYAGKLYAVGMTGDLVCMDAKTGKILWQKNYVSDFGGKVQAWGYSESVLVDDGKVICTPGSSDSAMVALNADTGATVWKTKVTNPGSAYGYSSPIQATIHGVSMYLNLLGKSGGVVGVDANTGKLLWQYTRIMNGTANIPTVVVKGNKVFCSTGYGDGGSALLEIVKDDNGFQAKELKYYAAKELQNHHGGMVLVGKYLYLGRGHNNGMPTCVEFDTAKIMWKEDAGAGRGTGSGCVAAADGMLYFRYQNGVVALVKASPEGFELAGRFEIPQKSSSPSWPHPVVANGRLYIRDQAKLHCFDIQAK